MTSGAICLYNLVQQTLAIASSIMSPFITDVDRLCIGFSCRRLLPDLAAGILLFWLNLVCYLVFNFIVN